MGEACLDVRDYVMHRLLLAGLFCTCQNVWRELGDCMEERKNFLLGDRKQGLYYHKSD